MSILSYADITERLMREFAAEHPLPVITAVVRQCRTTLADSPPHQIAHQLEQEARQRLSTPHPDLPTGRAHW